MAQQMKDAGPQPGSYFDVPGVPGGSSQWTEQDETSSNVTLTHSSASQLQYQGIQQYRQTDVVLDWYLLLNVAQTYTAGTSTITASAYAPMNLVGPTRQLIQNQYASVDVESGIDLYIFNLARPFDGNERDQLLNIYSNPAGDPVGGTATGYVTTALAQANQVNSAVWSSASTAFNLLFRLPAGQWFDTYYDLTVDGTPTAQPHPAFVSPQYMAGTTRNITPVISINPGNAATTDLGVANIGAGTGTYAGSSTLRLRRRAVYAGQLATAPPVYAWQYRWKTTRFGLGGISVFDFNLPNDTGQLLLVYTRLFDPSAASGLGAPINVNTVKRWNVQYGSGLFYFDAQDIGNTKAALFIQRQWLAKHGAMLPQGVMALDLALDERGQMTNARALNTLTTAGILVHVEFTSALSSTAYGVLGTESLVYVT